MKTIGILGGMGWESTAIYYRILNREVRRRLGGFHAAHIVLESFDFAELTGLQERGEWDTVQSMLHAAAMRLEGAGADFWLMACNTVHRVSDAIEASLGIPFLHIADPAGQALKARGIERVALLGTLHTMRADFYAKRLRDGYGIDTLAPDTAEQDVIHRLILDELVHGVASPEGRKALDEIGLALGARGSQATLLACTELGLLYGDEETSGSAVTIDAIPLFDTARLHALAAVDLALSA